jgi:hypothetical protein
VSALPGLQAAGGSAVVERGEESDGIMRRCSRAGDEEGQPDFGSGQAGGRLGFLPAAAQLWSSSDVKGRQGCISSWRSSWQIRFSHRHMGGGRNTSSRKDRSW